ncbi:hypothetical protein BKN38_08135 [Helicobacter sp. CLO-3]|uniref:GTPase domain-containing protein n=1 Tax=unclassified Helicobacter TaxID=2593540 RepID=UPI000805BD19|nr:MULTISPECIES: GTPase domain-containing protein [unclassified Helicobacter]OBV28748.1 hypothetical protein BA723_08140 [Helicobacter sp. CLO-3]OHU81853.1 hypothetical protein BKN38_08135 [Helicobacter sp. CLO-3]
MGFLNGIGKIGKRVWSFFKPRRLKAVIIGMPASGKSSLIKFLNDKKLKNLETEASMSQGEYSFSLGAKYKGSDIQGMDKEKATKNDIAREEQGLRVKDDLLIYVFDASKYELYKEELYKDFGVWSRRRKDFAKIPNRELDHYIECELRNLTLEEIYKRKAKGDEMFQDYELVYTIKVLGTHKDKIKSDNAAKIEKEIESVFGLPCRIFSLTYTDKKARLDTHKAIVEFLNSGIRD